MSLPAVLISVVVARKDDKFCVTDEKWGWYLPAGRVDFGECFTTAAVRESEEEAGLDAVLDGIYRFEFSVSDGFVRFRVVFAAHQRDESKPLKTEADDETYGAEWFTVKETIALARNEPDMMKRINSIPRIKALKVKGERPAKEKIRGSEIVYMFDWAEKGTKVFDMRLYYGEDGNDIDNKIVEVSTNFNIIIVIKDIMTNMISVEKISLSKKFNDFTETAINHCQQIKKKNKKSIKSIDIKYFCGVYHIAPQNKKDKATMSMCYYAETELIDKKVKLTFNNGESYLNESGDIAFGVKNVLDQVFAPLEMLAWEGSDHDVLN